MEPPGPATYASGTKLPRLHLSAYKGDIQGVLQCITDGCSLHETVSLRNQHGRLVCGITAIFLAAQRGHGEIVRLLVDNGASPVQPCFIQGSTELCTPAEVASLNLHFKLARYLKSAARARRREDEVLALDDDDRASHISSRLARGLERARSVRSVGAGSVAGNGASALGRMSRGSRAGGGASSVTDWPAAGAGTAGADGAEADPRRAALNFVQHVDLAAFDPETGGAVIAPAKPAREGGVRRLLRRFISLRGERGEKSGGAETRGPGGSWAGGGGVGSGASAASASRRVRGGAEAEREGGPDHTRVLQRFLKDLDLASWQPEHDGPLAAPSASQPAASGNGRHASPTRSTRSAAASPPRSLRG